MDRYHGARGTGSFCACAVSNAGKQLLPGLAKLAGKKTAASVGRGTAATGDVIGERTDSETAVRPRCVHSGPWSVRSAARVAHAQPGDQKFLLFFFKFIILSSLALSNQCSATSTTQVSKAGAGFVYSRGDLLRRAPGQRSVTVA
jgi:hypothetical protein